MCGISDMHKRMLTIVCIIFGCIIVFGIGIFISRNQWWKKIEGALYISEFTTTNGNYTGEGKLVRYVFGNDVISETVVPIPFEDFQINKSAAKLVGIVDDRQNNFYGIVEYDLENQERKDILNYEELQTKINNFDKTQTEDEIRQVEFGTEQETYYFLCAGKLWEFTGNSLEEIIEVEGVCYAWLDEETILFEKEGDMVSYNINTGKQTRLFSGCKPNSRFVISNNKNFLVYQEDDKHALYRYSFADNSREYLTQLSGDANMIISDDDKYIAYIEGYYTVSHSIRTKVQILDIENKNKKIINEYSGDIIGGISWGD